MQTVLIVFHLMIVVALVCSVLLQRSEGGALGVGGGGGFMTGRGQANALTRATAILAALFFVTSLTLSILASYNRTPKSILDTAPAGQVTAPVPGGTPLDQLRKLEEQRSGVAAPVDSAPATPSGLAAPPVSSPNPVASPAPGVEPAPAPAANPAAAIPDPPPAPDAPKSP